MTATMRERAAIRRTSAVGDEYAAEFESLAGQVLYTCAELGKFMNARGLNVGPLADAQNHAHASLAALRKVAEQLDPAADQRPAKLPPAPVERVSDRVLAAGVDVRDALAEAARLRGIDQEHVEVGSQRIAHAIDHFARLARMHEEA